LKYTTVCLCCWWLSHDYLSINHASPHQFRILAYHSQI